MAESIFWLEPTGEMHALTDNDAVNVLWGRSGAYAPMADLITDAVPLQAGTRIRGVRTQAREVDLPLFIQAEDEAQLRLRLRDIARWFDPSRGDGRLRIVPPAGATRDLVCRAPRGLQVVEDQGHSYWTTPPSAEVLVTFYAADPYWSGATPVSSVYAVTVPAGVGFPWPPIVLAASSIVSAPTEINPGDMPAQPVWTITGPGAGVTLTNVTTGQSLAIQRTLRAGDTVVIDARQGIRTVTMAETGENLYPDLGDGSVLWWLDPGPNLLRVDMPGVSTASSVRLSYAPRFRTV